MLSFFLLILLIIALLVAWQLNKTHHASHSQTNSNLPLSKDYYEGIHLLLNEQPDKAVDVFIKLLEVDTDTVDTHLALGNLFRKRGEVNRAIRIHQNLIARGQLNRSQRIQALYELGLDYMRAGVLDRAEGLFLELQEIGELNEQSLHQLLDIYQQQQDWEKAINIAEKMELTTSTRTYLMIAHYYCELAEIAKQNGDLDKAQQWIKKALASNHTTPRPYFVQANLAMDKQEFKQSLKAYKRILEHYPEYVMDIVVPLTHCYEKLNRQSELASYLDSYFKKNPNASAVASFFSSYLKEYQGDEKALVFLVRHIQNNPSLIGLRAIIELVASKEIYSPEQKEHWTTVKVLLEALIANLPSYQCRYCGFSTKTLYWNCPSCKQWDTIKPLINKGTNLC